MLISCVLFLGRKGDGGRLGMKGLPGIDGVQGIPGDRGPRGPPGMDGPAGKQCRYRMSLRNINIWKFCRAFSVPRTFLIIIITILTTALICFILFGELF